MREKKLFIQVLMDNQSVIESEDFNNYASWIGNLFTFYLTPVLIKKVQKLLIEFSEEEDAKFILPDKMGESIYTIKETFSYDEFRKSSFLRKKYTLLENVCKCLKDLYQHIGLNPLDVDMAYTEILDRNFALNVQLCGGMKFNRNRTIRAWVEAEYFLDHALIKVCFTDDRNMLVNSVDLFKTVPHHFIYSQLIDSVKWVNNEEFVLYNNSKELAIALQIDGSYKVSYQPELRDVEGIKEEIEFLTKEALVKL